MLQLKTPEDFVVGTGESHSVREFVQTAFEIVGIKNWKKYVGIDPRYYRPAEVEYLTADIGKAKKKLKWQPKTKFKDLIKIMLKHDLERYGQYELAAKIRLPKTAVAEPSAEQQRA